VTIFLYMPTELSSTYCVKVLLVSNIHNKHDPKTFKSIVNG